MERAGEPGRVAPQLTPAELVGPGTEARWKQVEPVWGRGGKGCVDYRQPSPQFCSVTSCRVPFLCALPSGLQNVPEGRRPSYGSGNDALLPPPHRGPWRSGDGIVGSAKLASRGHVAVDSVTSVLLTSLTGIA